jgi:hypothetical protein
MRFLAKAGGVFTDELCEMELDFLRTISYSLFVSDDELRDTKLRLLNEK